MMTNAHSLTSQNKINIEFNFDANNFVSSYYNTPSNTELASVVCSGSRTCSWSSQSIEFDTTNNDIHSQILMLHVINENSVGVTNKYVLGPSPMTFDTANTWCLSQGAVRLAYVNSSSDQTEAYAICNGMECWLGGMEVNGDASTHPTNQTWTWSDGSSMSAYDNFARNSSMDNDLGNTDERHVIMNATGYWEDKHLSYTARPLCEYPSPMTISLTYDDHIGSANISLGNLVNIIDVTTGASVVIPLDESNANVGDVSVTMILEEVIEEAFAYVEFNSLESASKGLIEFSVDKVGFCERNVNGFKGRIIEMKGRYIDPADTYTDSAYDSCEFTFYDPGGTEIIDQYFGEEKLDFFRESNPYVGRW